MQRAGLADEARAPGALDAALKQVAELMSVDCTVAILQAAWRLGPGARILHVGSGCGDMVAALRARGYDAVGVEARSDAALATPAALAEHNSWSELSSLPFADGAFDAVIDTGLYRTPPKNVETLIAEICRVAKHGVVLGSVTIDLTVDVIERYNLLEDAKVLWSRWDWAEKFYAVGFRHALFDRSRLGEAWEGVKSAGLGSGGWYEDPESLLYCVFERRTPASGGSGVPEGIGGT